MQHFVQNKELSATTVGFFILLEINCQVFMEHSVFTQIIFAIYIRVTQLQTYS